MFSRAVVEWRAPSMEYLKGKMNADIIIKAAAEARRYRDATPAGRIRIAIGLDSPI
jgi:hypothetical protein